MKKKKKEPGLKEVFVMRAKAREILESLITGSFLDEPGIDPVLRDIWKDEWRRNPLGVGKHQKAKVNTK